MDSRYKDMTSEIKAAEAAKAGSKEAFCELYGKYRDNLYRYALYRLGDPSEAEDAFSQHGRESRVSESLKPSEHGYSGYSMPAAYDASMSP